MKRILQFMAICLLAVINNAYTQTRYLDEVFTSVSVTYDVVYGNNLWCTMLGDCSIPTAKDLKMDVYEPAGDSLTERPLVIFMHSGNFLTPVINGGPTGFKTDSVVVEMCTRFAKKGYVAVSMDYRLGWNPTAVGPGGQAIRTGTIINAAYRGVQDAHTCIRFFKKNVDLDGNTYKICTSKIILGGIGTGSYIALAFASFDRWEEIYLNKLIDFTDPLNPVPYIDTSISGDFKSTLARSLNTPNHIGYSSNIKLAFNLGGALGDSSWMEIGDVPVVSFHNPKDENAPYGYGAVIVPTTGDLVLDASGSSDVIRRSNYLGNNNIFKMAPLFSDIYTMRANTLNSTGNITNEAGVVNPNAGDDGLYPIITPPPGPNICTDPNPPNNVFTESEQGGPWDWWDEVWYSNTAAFFGKDGPFEVCKARLSNPDMSAAKGRTYMDTLQGYLVPRIYRVLFENDSICVPDIFVGIEKNISYSNSITIYPNPSSSSLTILNDNTTKPITGIELYDVTGRLLRSEFNIRTNKYVMERNGLSPGLYFVNVRLEDGNLVSKVVFE